MITIHTVQKNTGKDKNTWKRKKHISLISFLTIFNNITKNGQKALSTDNND